LGEAAPNAALPALGGIAQAQEWPILRFAGAWAALEQPAREPRLPSAPQRFPVAPVRLSLARQAELLPPEKPRTFRNSGWPRHFRCHSVRSAHTLLDYSVI
jgi:hypothetical protein